MPPIFLRPPETPGRGPSWAGLAGAFFVGCLAAAFAATVWLSEDLSRRESAAPESLQEAATQESAALHRGRDLDAGSSRPESSAVRPLEPGRVDDPAPAGPVSREGRRSLGDAGPVEDPGSAGAAQRERTFALHGSFGLRAPSQRAGVPLIWEAALARVEEDRLQQARLLQMRAQQARGRESQRHGRQDGEHFGERLGERFGGHSRQHFGQHFDTSFSGLERPRLAIVIDDWGYPWEAANDILALPVPLTVAVLPHLPYSRAHAEAAERAGHEVILHLPLQALSADAPSEPGTIRVGMSPARVVQLTAAALDSVPQAVGVSNHQGSRATADRAVMYPLLAELKRRGLFYLDSYTNPETRGPEAAYALGVPFAVNRIFIDHDPDEEAVVARLRQAIDLAREEGHAIAIGHVRRSTQRALARVLPEIERAGVQLVTASQLIGLPGSGSERVHLPSPPEYARAWPKSLAYREIRVPSGGVVPSGAVVPSGGMVRSGTAIPPFALSRATFSNGIGALFSGGFAIPLSGLTIPLSGTERPASPLDLPGPTPEQQGKGS